jgi:catechol 2,3-dioxygenase-like lactoylglutathione lyase family enzyme
VTGRDAAITYGHHHLNVASIDAHRRFWVDGLGGRLVTINGAPNVIVEFRDTFVFLREQAPTGGMDGSNVERLAFRSGAFSTIVERVRQLGFGVDASDGIHGKHAALLHGPDGVRVELIAAETMDTPTTLDHIDLVSPDPAKTLA